MQKAIEAYFIDIQIYRQLLTIIKQSSSPFLTNDRIVQKQLPSMYVCCVQLRNLGKDYDLGNCTILQELHFSFDTNEFQLFRRAISVVEK